ncbi:MAG: winged helix-turn-helix transcriptional regulator [Methanomassiliicoccus sp.]|nr:winged helix-turn-helix transcriptional regulator [Methanomassiliicoccus sp.]
MTSQEMMDEIRSLRSEVGTLGDHMARLRFADIKNAFLHQIRMAVGDQGRRTFQSEASALSAASQCDLKVICLTKLEQAVDEAADRFMKDDLEAAKRILDDVEGLISGECSSCRDDDCSRSATETLRRVKAVLVVYEGLVERIGDAPVDVLGMYAEPTVTPEDVESAIAPLSNALRVRVLIALRRGDHSLSELGRAVDLRTGHLQFHLRALIDAGYVEADRRRHRYRITERGNVALRWTEDLVSRVGPAPVKDKS